MDIVIVTLLRNTLPTVIKKINKVIPDNNIILVTGEGFIGDLRNLGLSKVTSPVCAFIDDDVLITKEWYENCLETLENNDVIGCSLNFTICMMCKTDEFKKIGGFPHFDGHVTLKKGIIVFSQDFGVVHCLTDKELFLHSLKWFSHGFTKDFPFGHNIGITYSVRMFIKFIFSRPLLSMSYCFWFVKACFIKCFKFLGFSDVRMSFNEV